MVSPAGFNALLKLVEEPPDYVKFVFATTEPEKVLGTIKSRTHHYPFRLIPPGILRPYLEQLCAAEGVTVQPAVFPLVVRSGGGSARDSLSVLDQLIAGAGPEGVTYARAVALLGVTDVALIDEMCDALAAGDGAAAYATIDRVAEAGHDPRRFAGDLLERLRDLIVLQQVPDAATKGLLGGAADELERMTAQAERFGPATLSRMADIVHTGLVDMRGTTAPRLVLELVTARMLLPGADDSAAALLQRMERMERRLTLSGEETDSPVRTTPTPVVARSASSAGPTDAIPDPRGEVGAKAGGCSAGDVRRGGDGRDAGHPRDPAGCGAGSSAGRGRRPAHLGRSADDGPAQESACGRRRTGGNRKRRPRRRPGAAVQAPVPRAGVGERAGVVDRCALRNHRRPLASAVRGRGSIGRCRAGHCKHDRSGPAEHTWPGRPHAGRRDRATDNRPTQRPVRGWWRTAARLGCHRIGGCLNRRLPRSGGSPAAAAQRPARATSGNATPGARRTAIGDDDWPTPATLGGPPPRWPEGPNPLIAWPGR